MDMTIKMDMVIRVQIIDKVDCISHSPNTLRGVYVLYTVIMSIIILADFVVSD